MNVYATMESNANRSLGITQLAVMSAIRNHPEKAYGTAIAQFVSSDLNKEVSDAQVFVTLGRLERHGLVESGNINPEPSGARGRPKKIYNLTASGKRALEQLVSTLNAFNPRSPDRMSNSKKEIANDSRDYQDAFA